MTRSRCTVAFALFVSSYGWSAPSDDFAAGLTASKAGDYQRALVHFNAAHAGGKDSAVLQYNMGVVHYKLGNFEASKSHFSRITGDTKWGALAEYNLGLLFEKTGSPQRANAHYRNAFERASTEKLRQLARSKIEPPPASSDSDDTDGSWTTYASFGTGLDDNVTLADSSLDTVSDDEDYFVDLVGAASRYLIGTYDDGWRLDLTGYYRAHTDLDDFDFGAVSAGAYHNRLVTGWHVQAGVKANVQLAGGEPFTSGAVLRARAFHRLGKLGIRLTNDLGLIAGSDDYDYLSGVQNLTTIEVRQTIEDTRIRIGYQIELNDRDDLTLTDEFFSYSPTRHRIFASAERSLAEGLSAELRLGFRTSEYNDENIELEADDEVTQVVRDEDRVSTLR